MYRKLSTRPRFISPAIRWQAWPFQGIKHTRNKARDGWVKKILPALKHLAIEVFWVGADGGVEVEHHWDVWRQADKSAGSRDKEHLLMKYAGVIKGGPPEVSSRKGFSRG